MAVTCATCIHYSRPGTLSSRCKLGPPEWMNTPADAHPSYSIVRADNRCSRHSALSVDLEDRRAA